MKQKLLTCCFVIAIAAAATTVSSAPRMKIENSEFDFGYVPQNSKISHVFWIKSAGDDTLKILKVVPGWGCTKAPLDKKELAVGDSTRLEIIFSTKRYRNSITKRPRIETNEGPPHKSVQISTKVVVRPDSTYPVVIKPYKLDISQFNPTKVRDEMKFNITNVSEQDLKVTLISRPDGYFDLKLPAKISAGESAEGVLKLHSDALDKSFEKSITIELNDEAKSRFTIPVKRTVRKPASEGTTAVKAGK